MIIKEYENIKLISVYNLIQRDCMDQLGATGLMVPNYIKQGQARVCASRDVDRD